MLVETCMIINIGGTQCVSQQVTIPDIIAKDNSQSTHMYISKVGHLYYTFGKHRPIVIILSFLHSEMNSKFRYA